MDLDALARWQYGVVTRSQALHELSPGAVRARLDGGHWRAVLPGVYRAHTGELDWRGRASAALLHCGEGAALSLNSAAYLLGLEPKPPQVLQVDIPHHLKHTKPVGVRLRRRRTLRVTERQRLPITEPAFTVIDLGDTALASREDAIAVAARAVQRDVTSVDALTSELAARKRHRHRRALELSLGVIDEGAESVLEVGFVTDVLRAHGLPAMRMSVPDTVGHHSIRRDFLEEACRVVVELDGRLGHEGNRSGDNRRDRGTAAQGGVTLRAEWVDVFFEACQLAVDIFGTLTARGYAGTLERCGPTCTALRLLAQAA
ncbi:hypothetical protein AADG42_00980 [Ammonicoccus fulvus]|uniref:DUF559 domain-containing protein n=1 Tax=Ammonicoccus fulvus TaxID=3138240 RepID=A0ABZ3FK04_9ACTN